MAMSSSILRLACSWYSPSKVLKMKSAAVSRSFPTLARGETRLGRSATIVVPVLKEDADDVEEVEPEGWTSDPPLVPMAVAAAVATSPAAVGGGIPLSDDAEEVEGPTRLPPPA